MTAPKPAPDPNRNPIKSLSTEAYAFGYKEAKASKEQDVNEAVTQLLGGRAESIVLAAYRPPVDLVNNAGDRFEHERFQALMAERRLHLDDLKILLGDIRSLRTPDSLPPRPKPHPCLLPSALVLLSASFAPTLFDLIPLPDPFIKWGLAALGGLILGTFIIVATVKFFKEDPTK